MEGDVIAVGAAGAVISFLVMFWLSRHRPTREAPPEMRVPPGLRALPPPLPAWAAPVPARGESNELVRQTA